MSPECPKYLLDTNRDDIVRGVEGLQDVLSSWQNRAYPYGQRPLEQFDRTSQEWRELFHEAVMYDGSPETKQHLEDEAADVIIGTIGIVIAGGGNIAAALGRKLEGMFNKYPVEQLEELHAQGIEPGAALAIRKTLWSAVNLPPVNL